MKFKVNGKFEMGVNKQQKFEKIIEAQNKDTAIERIYSVLGSKHRVKRRQIEIDEIEKLN
ncbi:50S ribosomal protein L18Ae [Methanonatronarchaeum sp. AMET6-2]|uniref:50S ribosomal protein L18Ae n=1 Tax=Methanonatronarchaeum sp. AMET6-2 TaxID=2933293 RepID=UPI0011F8669F|nr:50S ribosomal protein L18Ae [Methanonatronarchaeum sp. AMET6-2]RZN63479.1 MAG: 50S ribosomal protein L18a [Methanonatronarchaeia archaeon]UOY09738.1 50S ribosomal protein L18Ae [Methanonatronarchaeum sp. AMET6-2]